MAEPTAGSSIESGGPGGEKQLAAVLAAVGDTLRLRILMFLKEEGRSVAEICQALDAAQPRISHHLAVLRKGGFLEAEVVGRKRIYRWTRGGPPSARRDLQALIVNWLHPEGDRAPIAAPRQPEASDRQPSARGDLEDYLL